MSRGIDRDRPTATPGPGTALEPSRSAVRYPGGLAARYRWVGSNQTASLIALSESGGQLSDHGPLVSADPDRMCRAELRIEGPLGEWTARFASPIFDEPTGVLWDVPGLLLVKYGFVAYALLSRTGELRWMHRAGTPLVAVLASSRLPHVIVQSEIETTAVRDDGTVAWRIAHSDVVAEAGLTGGQLILVGYSGPLAPIDPQTGQMWKPGG